VPGKGRLGGMIPKKRRRPRRATPKLAPRTAAVAKELGAAIRAVREKTGLSQEDFADKVGMTRQNYQRIEYGITNVTLDSLLRIADGLGVPCASLFPR
jgi:DNA-binding XRE family transcriptional regulator